MRDASSPIERPACCIFILLISTPAGAQTSPPTITLFSPASGPVGASVTITGTGFDAVPENNIVYFGGAQATVTSASATQLVVSAPAGATFMPISVTVPPLTAFSAAPFLVTFESEGTIDASSFAPHQTFSAGVDPTLGIMFGDLDGDGLLDAVVANQGSDNVSVFHNTSSGAGDISFAAHQTFAVDFRPAGIFSGDVDGDGKVDVITVNIFFDNVSVLRNTVNAIPALTGLDDVTFFENTVNAAPQIIDSDVSFSDPGGGSLEGGSLSVTYSDGGGAEDQLGIADQGAGSGQISVSGATVGFEGNAIGTITSDGSNGGDLMISFTTTAATVSAVEALIEALTYANTSDTPAGQRTISVTIEDNGGPSVAVAPLAVNAPATAVITVNAENDAPTISDIADQVIDEDGMTKALAFTIGDAEDDTNSLIVTAASSNPGLAPADSIVFGGSGANRTVQVTPVADGFGSVTITVTVTDSGDSTATDTFVVTVNPLNDAPVAVADADTTGEDVAISISVIANDTDADGDTLKVTAVTAPENGAVAIDPDSTSVTYTPEADFSGQDSFTYTISDGNGGSDQGSVTVIVASPPLTLALGSAAGAPNATVHVPFTLDNPTDSPVGALQFEVIPNDTGAVQFENAINDIDGLGFSITTRTINDTTIVVVHPTLNPDISNTAIPPGLTALGQLLFRLSDDLAPGTVVTLHINGIVLSDTSGVALPDSGVDGTITGGITRGDLNDDGDVNVQDIVLLLPILLGQAPAPDPGAPAFIAADANGDGTINVLDVVHQINLILRLVTRPLAAGPATPVTVSLGDVQMGSAGQMAVPVVLENDGALAAMQSTFTFDPARLQIGTPQVTGRSEGMTVQHHVSDGRMQLVVYSLSGRGIAAGSGPVLWIPVTVIEEDGTAPLLSLSETVLADHRAQMAAAQVQQDVVKVSSLPAAFSLSANRPNPFNPSTTIAYEVAQQAHVTLTVYNILGQEVARLVDRVQTPGRYTVTWRGKNAQGLSVASGVYLYRITTDKGFTQTRRMTLLK